MTTLEFSTEFDILYDNISNNTAPGLNSYEKSLFLTMALEQLIKNYYKGISNVQETFQESEDLQRYFANSIVITSLKPLEGTNPVLFPNAKTYNIPNSVLYITNEFIRIGDINVSVIPIILDHYNTIIENPFKRNNTRRALSIDIGNNKKEVLYDYNYDSYNISYIKKPSPIILEDLPQGLTIDGYSDRTECSLPISLHREILTRAVSAALSNIEKQST